MKSRRTKSIATFVFAFVLVLAIASIGLFVLTVDFGIPNLGGMEFSIFPFSVSHEKKDEKRERSSEIYKAVFLDKEERVTGRLVNRFDHFDELFDFIEKLSPEELALYETVLRTIDEDIENYCRDMFEDYPQEYKEYKEHEKFLEKIFRRKIDNYQETK